MTDDARKKRLEEFLDNLEKGNLEFTDKDGKKRNMFTIKTSDSFKEREQALLAKIEEITRQKHRKQQRYIFALMGTALILLSVTLYLYFEQRASVISYSILPGGIQEVKITGGNLWINGNSKVTINENDSIINLIKGQLYLSKNDSERTYTVLTPDNNRITLFKGNMNVISREQKQRISSLGVLKIITSTDTINLKYGKEYRNDSGYTSIRTLQAPLLISEFKNGKLAFEDEPLDFVVQQLSAYYNIKISYKTLPNTVVSFIANKTDDPKKVLQQILPIDWTVKKSQQEYIITHTNKIRE